VNSKVCIIHSSAIVQNGLAEILGKYFKFSVKGYSTFNDFQEAEENITNNTILLTEDEIANLFRIMNCAAQNTNQNDHHRIYLYSSPDDIYEQVKAAFKQLEPTEEESEGLSNREIEVLKLVALGYANKEIAEKLYISTHTVISHRKNITEKLGIKSISGLTVYAIINNYIDTTNIDIHDLI
jgi:DNA-binding NarL/FixJ family response regulator